MAELAEGARLLSEYGDYTPSWVRIPFSPPPENTSRSETFQIGSLFIVGLNRSVLEMVQRIRGHAFWLFWVCRCPYYISPARETHKIMGVPLDKMNQYEAVI
jgi:hypothetical protein